jgi:hypothetical protein
VLRIADKSQDVFKNKVMRIVALASYLNNKSRGEDGVSSVELISDL